MPIPSVPDFLENVLGYEAEVTTIPSVTEDGSGGFSYQSGFPAVTGIPISNGGIAPNRKDMNAVIKMMSKHLFWQQSGGLYSWDSALNYVPGNHVLGSDGVEYICQLCNGPDYTGIGYKDPTTDDGTYWKSAAMAFWSIISSSDEYASAMAELNATEVEAFRKSMIGTPRYWRSTSLPDNHCWANGDLVYFEDWPELADLYNGGGFSGMLMAYNASTSTQNSNLGMWRPNDASPTGLYVPNLTSRFLRGTAASGGTTNSAGLPNISGQFQNVLGQSSKYPITASGAHYKGSSSDDLYTAKSRTYLGKYDGVYFQASRSNSIYGNSSTVMPASVNVPIVIYLGASA